MIRSKVSLFEWHTANADNSRSPLLFSVPSTAILFIFGTTSGLLGKLAVATELSVDIWLFEGFVHYDT